jgi:hypothetical protein
MQPGTMCCVSHCHAGEVVASYGEPVASPCRSYEQGVVAGEVARSACGPMTLWYLILSHFTVRKGKEAGAA